MHISFAALSLVRKQLWRIRNHPSFYTDAIKDIDPDAINCQEAFESLPFCDKGDLRNAYPLGLSVVDEREIVRIHSSSGTTGTPVVIPYTAGDVADWAEMFCRCYQIAGITPDDRLQITPGYGLWTAGIGFQAGCEKLGAMAIPMGPGNTEKQLRFMHDLKTTVLCATSSYALLLSEEIEKSGLRSELYLRKAVIGSEKWGDKTRQAIRDGLKVQLYDIYGLTEIYGPGIAVSCDAQNGMHYFDDYLYFEVIDPVTGKVLPDGEIGELVITTLRKQAAPLIRYRTHDITRILPGQCSCGCPYPRIDRVIGRTDDMVKVKGVNIYPGQLEDLIARLPEASGEYRITAERLAGRDSLTLEFETNEPVELFPRIAEKAVLFFKSRIGIHVTAIPLPYGKLPRSEKKTTRIFDKRD